MISTLTVLVTLTTGYVRFLLGESQVKQRRVFMMLAVVVVLVTRLVLFDDETLMNEGGYPLLHVVSSLQFWRIQSSGAGYWLPVTSMTDVCIRASWTAKPPPWLILKV